MPSMVYSLSSKRISWETDSGVATLLYGKVFKGEMNRQQIEVRAVLGILKVERKELGASDEFFAYVTKSDLVGMYEGAEIHKIERIKFLCLDEPYKTEGTILQIRSFIQSHDFYYISENSFIEDEFIWNKHMRTNLLRYFGCDVPPKRLFHHPSDVPTTLGISTLFCGFFVVKTFKASADFYHMKLLSLVSSNRVGARYFCRGVDEEGNVSFFVRTNFKVKKNNNVVFNFNTVRGSIPIFWNQRTPTKVSIHNDENASRRAFVKHFKKLEKEYGKVHVVNLLGQKEYEKLLALHFNKFLDLERIPHTSFDMNAYVNDYENLKLFFYFKLQDIGLEDVIFRVNCLDCLDRTNIAQSMICKLYLQNLMNDTSILRRMQECWIDNGNSLSNLYTGSGTMRSELPLRGRRSFLGYMDDFVVLATRFINAQFTDKQKHIIINILLEKDRDS